MNKRFGNTFTIMIAIVLTITTVVSLGYGSVVYGAGTTADTGDTIDKPAGLMEMEGILLDEELTSDTPVVVDDEKYSAIYSSDWDKYASYYYYNQLTGRQREIWDETDRLCASYLYGSNVNASFPGEGEYNYVGEILCTQDGTWTGKSVFSSENDCKQFFYMFRYCNPQYYFISNRIAYTTGAIKVYPIVYDDFVSGANRSSATANMKTRLDSWVNELGMPTSETDKLNKAKLANDIICRDVEYTRVVIDAPASEQHALEEQYKTQSGYSAIVSGQTVCVGYAVAYEALCDAVGIDTVCITCDGHAWNAVRVNNSWYNVDTTWADQTSGVIYTYFMKSDADYMNDDSHGITMHTPISWWNGRKPPCTLTTGSTRDAVGSLSSPVGTVATPVIMVSRSGGGYTISMSDSTAGATIYYATDGSMPCAAYGKCSIYSSTFTVSDYSKVKAIAVKDQYLDSSISTATYDDGGTYAMYRMFLPGAAEHFYTGDEVEIAALVKGGWIREGVAWYAPKSGDPVYRLYLAGANVHHYTTSAYECDELVKAGWSYDGVAFFSGGDKPIYRLLFPPIVIHLFTGDASEVGTLCNEGWVSEAVGWYAVGTP